MRRHVLLGVGYNELRLRDESKVYQYGGNWFAAVSCVCIRDRLRVVGHLQRRMKMVNHQRDGTDGTRGGDVLTWNDEQRRCHSSVTSNR